MILFIVKHKNTHVVTWAHEREGAKSNAKKWLKNNPDEYIITPLTKASDLVILFPEYFYECDD
jgi:hypothetical protein